MISSVASDIKPGISNAALAGDTLNIAPLPISPALDEATARLLAKTSGLRISPQRQPAGGTLISSMDQRARHPSDRRFVRDELLKFGRPAAAAQLTPYQTKLYADSYRRGAAYASARFGQAVPDILFPNTNPPGQHDSRSLPMIETNPRRRAAFEKMSPKDRQRVLYEADFYWAGVDSVVNPLAARTKPSGLQRQAKGRTFVAQDGGFRLNRFQ